MIGLVFLIVLAWQFYIGYARGIILQAYCFLASLLSLVIAAVFYKTVANTLTLWIPFVNPTPDASVIFFAGVNIFELDQVFYAGSGFLFVYVISYLVFRLLGIFLYLIDLDKFDDVIFNSLSGVLSVVITIMFFSMASTILASIPVVAMQQFLMNSFTTRLLIGFPLFSQLWYYFLVSKIL